MRNKSFGYKIFFLTQILILPFALRALATEDLFYTESNDTATSTIIEVDGNLELNLETDDLGALMAEEIIEKSAEASTVSSSLPFTEADENLELYSETDDLDALIVDKSIEKNVEKEQFEWLKSNDKYKQIKKDETNGSYEVHEYETPDGEIGYQILYYNDFGEVIRSKGYGIEAESRTWTQTYPTFTTFTTTTL